MASPPSAGSWLLCTWTSAIHEKILCIDVMDPSPIAVEQWSTEVRSVQRLRTVLASPRRAPVVELDIFRHGQTVANADRVVSGLSDVPLTERGREEAQRIGHILDGVYAAAFHSSLSRSRQTLAIAMAASTAQVRSVIEDERVAERSMGVLEGQPIQPLRAYDEGDLHWAPTGGEPYIGVAARVISFLLDLQDAARTSGGRLRVIVCTHAGPMRVLLGVLTSATDPRAVLTGRHANATMSHAICRELTWPPFLSGDPHGR